MAVDIIARGMAGKALNTLPNKADLVGGKVPASELPSYVDDVIEGYYYNNKFYEDEEHTTEIEPERGKIYIDLTTSNTYRWSGSIYVGISIKYTAGDGIKIEDNVISIDADSGIAIYDTRIADANAWLTNGYVKTRNTTSEFEATINLPAVCTGNDRWGVLLYVAENNDNKAGLQQYFPIDGTYKGRVFYRSVTGTTSSPPNPIFGTWNLVPWSAEKQDTLVSGTNIKTVNNESVLGEGNIDTATDDDVQYTNATGTTVAVGGIAKGTTFTNKPLKEILEDMLYPYVQFTFNSISTTPASGTFEYGTQKTITAVTPSFTLGSKSISSVKVGSTSGGSDLYTGSSATSGSAITLTTTKVLDGLSNATIYCTLGDGTNTAQKSTTFTFAKYNYYKVTDSTDIPTTGATNIGTSTVVNSITTTDNTYIWFLVPTTKTKIQQFAMNQWNDMTTTSAGSFSFTTDAGQTLTYYAYRTDKMVAATGKYQII